MQGQVREELRQRSNKNLSESAATATPQRMRARWRGVKVIRLVYLQRIVSDRAARIGAAPIGAHRKVAYTIGQNFLTLAWRRFISAKSNAARSKCSPTQDCAAAPG
jgi:hypothetical protein